MAFVVAVSNRRKTTSDLLVMHQERLRKDIQCTAVLFFDINSAVPGGPFTSAAGAAAAAWGLSCF
jgi:hypothetical protein